MTTPLLEAKGISKAFGGNSVLNSVSLNLSRGEVVSIVGENGAGKSTLAKIIAGIVTPDEGALQIDGQALKLNHPRDAITAGIAMVHQELNVAENLSISENILLGREVTRYGLLSKSSMNDIARRALARLEIDLNPQRLASTLSTAQRQMVEIARALAFDAKILILDEPTSSLSEQESDRLLDLVLQLNRDGLSVLYVSHRIPEIQRISDRIVALRDGSASGTLTSAPFERSSIIELMVGRDIKDMYGYTQRKLGATALELRIFQASPKHTPCDLSVRAGEIVGIAGLIGSGRTELLESIIGVTQAISGTIAICGKEVAASSPQATAAHGVTLVPESRKEQGVIARSTILENINLSILGRRFLEHPQDPTCQKSDKRAAMVKFWARLLRNRSSERTLAEDLITKLAIRCTGPEQLVAGLSGGNQQKVVLARCLATQPKVLLLDEPTRGVDVGARREIYSILFSLAAQGLAIIFVSSELEEVVGIADRVVVMSDGTITGELQRDALSEHAIMSLAAHQQRRAA